MALMYLLLTFNMILNSLLNFLYKTSKLKTKAKMFPEKIALNSSQQLDHVILEYARAKQQIWHSHSFPIT